MHMLTHQDRHARPWWSMSHRPDHASKVRFLRSLDVLSVPTTYREPKGLYVLEALANGVPVVQPRHGSFPGIDRGHRRRLAGEPRRSADLARGLYDVLNDRDLRERLGRQGKEAVHAASPPPTWPAKPSSVYEKYLNGQRLPHPPARRIRRYRHGRHRPLQQFLPLDGVGRGRFLARPRPVGQR